MKNYFLISALILSSFSLFSQDKKMEKKSSDLSPFEVQFTRGGWIPDLGLNYYFKENLVLKVDALQANNFYSTFEDQTLTKRRVGAFLEMRKYKENSGWFFSHGPSIGYEFTTGDSYFGNSEFQAGYNVGAGYRLSKHFNAGTYISPYVGFSESGTSFLHGRLFLGTLQNLYLAYRF